MPGNGHASLDGLLDALAQRVGSRSTPHHDDALLGLHEKVDHLAHAVERLVELVESRRAHNGIQPRLLSRAETAKFLGVSVSQIDALRRRGRLRATVVESRPMFDRNDLDAFIEGAKETTVLHGAVAED